MNKFLLAVILSSISQSSFAQLLPKGVGAVQVGYRKFDGNAQYFDEGGSLRSAGDKFKMDFSSKDMVSGRAGESLKKLYDEVKKLDSQGVSQGVADDMNFGQVEGDVKTDISAKFVGFAFGLTDKVTLFGGLPFVNAKVDTTIRYAGENNASAIKQRLGNTVFKEVQDGLDTASKLNSDTIRENLEVTNGYAPIDHWEYNGVGDLVFGARTEVKGSRFGLKKFKLGLSAQADIATGHQDDPDVLTDINIGRGYHALTLASDLNVSSRRGFTGGVTTSLTQGLSRDVSKRVPTGNSTIVAKDRTAAVNWQPGQDVTGGVYFGYGKSYLRGVYSLGTTRHLQDQYSGSMEGNYSLLESETEYSKLYQQVGLSFSTVEAYAQKKMSIPFVLSFVAHDTISGTNTPRARYFEMSIASFFKS